MNRKTKQVILDLVLILLVSTPVLVLAQIENPTTYITSISGVISVLNFILRIIYTIFFILAAVFLILAAFTYLTAGGESDKVKKAKNQLIYAIVAIVVALLAVGIRGIVASVLAQQG